MSARAAHRALEHRSDRNIICDFIGILHLIFTYFFIDMRVGNVGDDECKGAASAPALNTAA
jgi:hypothetical protein